MLLRCVVFSTALRESWGPKNCVFLDGRPLHNIVNRSLVSDLLLACYGSQDGLGQDGLGLKGAKGRFGSRKYPKRKGYQNEFCVVKESPHPVIAFLTWSEVLSSNQVKTKQTKNSEIPLRALLNKQIAISPRICCVRALADRHPLHWLSETVVVFCFI